METEWGVIIKTAFYKTLPTPLALSYNHCSYKMQMYASYGIYVYKNYTTALGVCSTFE